MNEGCNLKNFNEWYIEEIKLYTNAMTEEDIKNIAEQAWNYCKRQEWKIQDGYFRNQKPDNQF